MTVLAGSTTGVAVDAWLLGTALRRLGPHGARMGALALATWVTIGATAAGVSLALALRVAAAAGLPDAAARAVVVVSLSAPAVACVIRLVGRSSLPARLASADPLRAALGVSAAVRARVATAVHVWLLGIATAPIALSWLAWDSHPWVWGAVIVVAGVALAGVLLLRHVAAGARADLVARRCGILGAPHRMEVVALLVACAVSIPAVRDLIEPVAHAVAAMPGDVDTLVVAALVGLAVVVTADRLLDPRTPSRLRLARALVEAGAAPMAVAMRMTWPALATWSGIAVAAALAAWTVGGTFAAALAAGCVALASGASTHAIALGVASPPTRILAAASAASLLAVLAPVPWATVVVAGIALAAAPLAALHRLRCTPS